MIRISVDDFLTDFDALMAEVEAGEIFVLTENDEELAAIVPIAVYESIEAAKAKVE